MRRLAQFVRLRASRVGRLVSRLHAFVSRASVCVCSRQGFRMRLASHVGRLVSHLSRVRLASVCVCSRQGFRMRASRVSRRSSCLASVVLFRICLASVVLFRICLASVVLSRICLASVVLSRVGRLVSRRSSCLASACVCPCECLRELAHFMRRSSFREFGGFLLSSYYLIMSQCQSIHPIT